MVGDVHDGGSEEGTVRTASVSIVGNVVIVRLLLVREEEIMPECRLVAKKLHVSCERRIHQTGTNHLQQTFKLVDQERVLRCKLRFNMYERRDKEKEKEKEKGTRQPTFSSITTRFAFSISANSSGYIA